MRLNFAPQRTWLVASLIASTLSVAASPVAAQGRGAGWLSDRDRTEGPGIRLGDFELHPGIGTELGYDSNIFYSQPGDEVSAAILRITPHFNVSTLGNERSTEGETTERGDPPTVTFRAGLSASYYIYFTDETRDNLSADADIRLTVLPERPFSFTIFNTFGRSVRPFTETGPEEPGDPGEPLNYARLRNTAGVRFDFGTDGGIFRANLGYQLRVDFFEGEAFDYANSLSHTIDAGTSWRFLPSTAFVYDLQLHFDNWINTDEPSAVLRPNATRVRSRVGLNGAVTNNFSIMGMVGYAAGFYDIPLTDEYESVAVQAEVRWQPAPTTRLSLGYDGDYHPSFSGTFARRDRGYTNVQFLILGRFLLGVEAAVAYFTFGPQLTEAGAPLGFGGETERSDLQLQAGLFAEYRLADWFGINASVDYTGNYTDFVYARNVSGSPVPDAAEYQKIEAWFGVRAFY
jgi:hypothetical protein